MRTHSRISFFRSIAAVTLLALLFFPPCFPQNKAVAQVAANPAQPKVRAITAFINIDRSRYQIDISDTIKFLKYARTVFESRGYAVQTLRIATQPFPEYTKGLSREEAMQFFKNLDGIAQQEHIVIAIGPAFLAGNDGDAQADLLAEILSNTKSLFGTVSVTKDDSINWPAVSAAARVIKKLSETTEHSEGNFHFAAIASMPPYSPFFPAAYHTGAGHQFTIGLESANTVAVAFQDAPDYQTAKRRLFDLLFEQTSAAEALAQRSDHEQGWTYLGIDLSPAPMRDVSIGAAIESLTRKPLGSSGTLTTVGLITSALKEIGVRKIGYSGLMLPVMEDSRIAERWNSGLVSMDTLLSYSAVCGTGLDTIPLPGDTSVDELTRIISDVATLSVKWNKPLSARLLPVAGKHAGETTEFTDPNLINVTVQPAGSK
jgi:uncharacterized protein (UPF0210 family)